MAHNKIDNICKTTVEDHTADMLRFFYPDAELIIDFDKGFELLDTQLADINPDINQMKDARITDKVIKAYTLSGDILFIIISVEFQAYYDPEFGRRMFIYFYWLLDKHFSPVSMIIIHTDKSADRCLSSFNSSLLNTDLHFSFKPYKVWEQDENELLQSNNPYAFVILTIISGRKKREKQRLAKGILLANIINNKPFDETTKFNLVKFMKLYFHFANPDLRIKFDAAINKLQSKTKTMGIIEYEKMLVREEALEQGKKNVAKNLLQMGFDLAAIRKATELPLKKIKELAVGI